MSVLVFAESSEGKFKKSSFELTSYGKKVAEQLGTNLVVLTINATENETLYKYGADKVLQVTNDALAIFNAKIYANVVKQAAEKENSKVVIIDSNTNGLYLAPIVAINLNAGFASNVVALPSSTLPFTVKRKAFSSKGFNTCEISTDVKVIGLSKNAYGIFENEVSGNIESFSPEIITSNLTSEKIEQTTGKVTIADADIVVSGGRGLKGPENWGMIEE